VLFGACVRRSDAPLAAPFAPPEAIAAAAARAAKAASKVARAASAGTPLAAPKAAPLIPAAPTDAAAAGALQGQSEEQAVGVDGPYAGDGRTPALIAAAGANGASKPLARTAADAGMDEETAAGDRATSVIKRAKRLGGGGGGGRGARGGGGGGNAGGANGGGGGGGRRGGSAVVSARPVTYADLGGVDDVLSSIKETIEYPLKHPEVRLMNWM
jgi:ribosome biogenesis ATPase